MSVATASGVRYPTLGFMTGGTGDSDEGIPPQPFETYAYDLALQEAQIENFNIVKYTSVLPPELWGYIWLVNDVSRFFKHGAVLEVIMAGEGVMTSDHPAIATGVGLVWAADSSANYVGGYAAEYIKQFDHPVTPEEAEREALKNLKTSLDHELMIRGHHALGPYNYFHNFLNPKLKYGYCMTVLGFLNFAYAPPVPQTLPKPSEPVFLTD